MSFDSELVTLFTEYGQRKANRSISHLQVSADDPWQIEVRFELNNQHTCLIRPLQHGDEILLARFGKGLSERSRNLFGPHPWLDDDALMPSLHRAIENAITKIDAAYLMLIDEEPAGFFFLWMAGHNPHSAQYNVEIPELGIAVADAYHGMGLGRLLMQFLQIVSKSLDKDAIELTTGMTNEKGYRTYQSVGFEEVGVIPTPLEVDVAAFAAGKVQAHRYRQERQMLYILNHDKNQKCIDYMARKREHMDKLCENLEKDRYEETA